MYVGWELKEPNLAGEEHGLEEYVDVFWLGIASSICFCVFDDGDAMRVGRLLKKSCSSLNQQRLLLAKSQASRYSPILV